MKKENPFLASKTIYAKPKKYNFKGDDAINALRLEIDYHLRKFPNVQLKNVDAPIDNDDKSKTYLIHFESKQTHDRP